MLYEDDSQITPKLDKKVRWVDKVNRTVTVVETINKHDLPEELHDEGIRRHPHDKTLLTTPYMSAGGSLADTVNSLLSPENQEIMLDAGFERIQISAGIYDIATKQKIEKPKVEVQLTATQLLPAYEYEQIAPKLEQALSQIQLKPGSKFAIEEKLVTSTESDGAFKTERVIQVSLVVHPFPAATIFRFVSNHFNSGDGRGADRYEYKIDVDVFLEDVKNALKKSDFAEYLEQ